MGKKICLFGSVIVVFALFIGCSAHQPSLMDDVQTLTTVNQKLTDYFIREGDQLSIKFFFNPELNEQVTVRPDGKITLQLIDEVQAAGLKPSQLDVVLTEKYSQELRKPDIAVIVSKSTGLVFVGGEVGFPQQFQLTPGLTVLSAIMAARGPTDIARMESVLVIRKGSDNRPIPITIDLKNTLSGKYGGADLPLQPYDIVYVPKSAIGNAHKFIRSYIQGLLMFGGWSAGYSFGSIND